MRTALTLTLLSALVLVQQAPAQEELAVVSFPRSVTVRGEGVMRVEPDTATVEMGIFVFDPDLLTAKKEADRKVVEILGAFKKLGAKPEDMQTTQLKVTPKFKDVEETWEFVGYEITRSITVTVHEIPRLNDFLDKSIEAGANRIVEIELSTSKQQELGDETLTKAMTNAKRQAARLAEGFGARLGKVLRIETNSYSGDDVRYNLLFSASVFGESSYQAGTIKIESDVEVVFELVD